MRARMRCEFGSSGSREISLCQGLSFGSRRLPPRSALGPSGRQGSWAWAGTASSVPRESDDGERISFSFPDVNRGVRKTWIRLFVFARSARPIRAEPKFRSAMPRDQRVHEIQEVCEHRPARIVEADGNRQESACNQEPERPRPSSSPSVFQPSRSAIILRRIDTRALSAILAA